VWRMTWQSYFVRPYYQGTNLDPDTATSSAGTRKMLESASYEAYDASIGEHLMDPYPTTTRAVVYTNDETQNSAVGRCRLTVSKPVLKAPMVSALETIEKERGTSSRIRRHQDFALSPVRLQL